MSLATGNAGKRFHENRGGGLFLLSVLCFVQIAGMDFKNGPALHPMRLRRVPQKSRRSAALSRALFQSMERQRKRGTGVGPGLELMTRPAAFEFLPLKTRLMSGRLWFAFLACRGARGVGRFRRAGVPGGFFINAWISLPTERFGLSGLKSNARLKTPWFAALTLWKI